MSFPGYATRSHANAGWRSEDTSRDPGVGKNEKGRARNRLTGIRSRGSREPKRLGSVWDKNRFVSRPVDESFSAHHLDRTSTIRRASAGLAERHHLAPRLRCNVGNHAAHRIRRLAFRKAGKPRPSVARVGRLAHRFNDLLPPVIATPAAAVAQLREVEAATLGQRMPFSRDVVVQTLPFRHVRTNRVRLIGIKNLNGTRVRTDAKRPRGPGDQIPR